MRRALQQTSAAMLLFRSSLSLSAAATAEFVRSTDVATLSSQTCIGPTNVRHTEAD